MSKISDYLRQHLTGDVVTNLTVRRSLATDASIFQITPQLVVYPRTTNDVRKVARFAWRLAERGQALPITARGGGTSQTGSAIGAGVLLSFPSHMSRILELDVKSRMVRLQPGLNLLGLQEAMATHGLFLPIMPHDFQAATIGGALASNATGSRQLKYGSFRDWTDRLEVVLSNGEVIQTERLSRHALNAKKGLQTMEGEIYRALDALIDENAETLARLDCDQYAINLVKKTDGSFDLTPLMIGSEGTLGIISQAIVELAPRPNEVEYIAAAVTSQVELPTLTEEILKLEPSELEFIDGGSLKLIEAKGGGQPWKQIADELPDKLIFIEFDDRHHGRKARKAAKILAAAGVIDAKIAGSFEDQETLRSVHHSVAFLSNFSDKGTSALPLGTVVTVQPSQVPELVDSLKKLLKKNHIEGGIWGSLGAGTVELRPLMNLANLGQRQTVFKLMGEVRNLATAMNGLASDGSGGGRLASPYLVDEYGSKAADLIAQLKQIFDPFNILNPGVKVGTTQEELVKILRQDYNQTRYQQFNLRG